METPMKHLLVRHFLRITRNEKGPTLLHVIIDQVRTAGAAGALHEALVPDSLRSSISQPDWFATLIQMVAGTVPDGSAEWLDAPIPSPRVIYAELLIERLRSCLSTHPLAHSRSASPRPPHPASGAVAMGQARLRRVRVSAATSVSIRR